MFTPHALHNSKFKITPILALVIAVGTPSVVLANVGTPLIWVTIFHLYVGNAFIGILEGAVLARVYGVSASRAIGLMILANYLSAWVGWVWLSGLLQDHADINLYNARYFMWGMVVVAYVATILIEWPFVAGCFRGREDWFRRSCSASLVVQTVSYILLSGWFYSASANSLFTDMTIVSIDQISLPSNVRIYYISDEDGDVYSLKLDSDHPEKVLDLNSRDFADCLSFEDSQVEKGTQEIVALLESADINQPKVVSTKVVILNEDCPQYADHDLLRNDRFARPRSYHEGEAMLGRARGNPWTFRAGYWSAQGLSGENSKTGANMRLALETPFVEWPIRHVIVLPANKVLFQLGERQICILDPETRKVAVLRIGRGAVAVIEHSGIPLKDSK